MGPADEPDNSTRSVYRKTPRLTILAGNFSLLIATHVLESSNSRSARAWTRRNMPDIHFERDMRRKPGSIQRRLNSIAEAHKAAALDSPTTAGMVKNTMKGIRRTLGTAPVQKSPTLTDDIRAMVDAADLGLIGARDRALILLGFAGAFRRSELVALDIDDCAFGRSASRVRALVTADWRLLRSLRRLIFA